MNSLLISIIIPTYNRVNLIGDTLDSVLAQTYTNWECIVVDDGSTDKTNKLLAVYCEKDPRFQYHQRPNDRSKGANACRNYGFELSKGEYIKWLDSDDLISCDALFSQINTLKTNSKNKNTVVTAKWNYFKDNIDDIKPELKEINKNYANGIDLIYDFGNYNTFLPSHVYLISRNIIIKSGLWNEALLINQDGEFFVRVLLNASEIIHAKDGMVYYRYSVSEDNVSSFSNSRKSIDSILSWILIDTYIKVYTKEMKTIKYVENAKKVLLNNIAEKKTLKQYTYFLKKESFAAQFINKIKNRLLNFRKKFFLNKNDKSK